jgi:TatA/E family protein of Tat protein translocase
VSLGPAEIIVIFVVALLVFGPSRLPEVARQVGKGMRELRKLQQSISSDLDTLIPEDVTDHIEPAPSLPPKRPDPSPEPDPEAASTETPDRDSGAAATDLTAPPPDSTA